MRVFDYRKNYRNINIDVKSYINELIKELNYLIEIENLDIYKKALNIVNNFSNKYQNLSEISDKILNDLISPENVNYCFKTGHYKDDASKIGVEFQNDLNKIFELEEELAKIAAKKFEVELTGFDDIENGKDFIVVGHASYNLPGTINNYNYKKDYKEYLSCSLFSNNELNVFMNQKIVYLVDVNEENYISSSYFDVSTRQNQSSSIFTVKKIGKNNACEYIDVGYTKDSKKFALSILTPKAVEKMSVERELKETNKSYSCDALTNEIVLYRAKTYSKNALLISDETELLIDEFMKLKENNVEFKCINRGLYKEKNNQERYDKNKLYELNQKLTNLGIYDVKLLEEYYREVVLKMNYSDDILLIINSAFSKYIDIDNINSIKLR